MQSRGINRNKIEAVLYYGRCVHTRGAFLYVIGHKEIKTNAKRGINLEDCEGVQVVCTSEHTVLTVYRNRNLRKLRTKHKYSYQQTIH